MLKLRMIGLSDYSVLEGRQRIGRIRLATERMPCVWLWNVSVHLPGGLPMGSAKDLNTAKSEFREAWKAAEGQDPAGATRGGLPGNEYPRRGLTRIGRKGGGKARGGPPSHLHGGANPEPCRAVR
jgi:hypothetical protein